MSVKVNSRYIINFEGEPTEVDVDAVFNNSVDFTVLDTCEQYVINIKDFEPSIIDEYVMILRSELDELKSDRDGLAEDIQFYRNPL